MLLDSIIKKLVFFCFFEKYFPIAWGPTATYIKSGRVHSPGAHLPDELQSLPAQLP